MTFHSFFSIKPFGIATHEKLSWVKKEKRKMWDKITTIIIDEVSMLRADVLDAADMTLQQNGCVGLAQKQIIFVGDLKQLKPILKGKEELAIFRNKYTSTCFQDSEIYKQLDVKEVSLTKVFRQDNVEFKKALDVLRDSGSNYMQSYFRQFIQPIKNEGVIIAPVNDVVEYHNVEGLKEISEPLITYTGRTYGEYHDKHFNVSREISVKHGCKIMYLCNHPSYPLVNGTLGTFLLVNNTPYIRVGNYEYPIDITEFEYQEYQTIVNELDKTEKVKLITVCSIEQYPIRVAYAISINKSQGLSLSPLTLDLRTTRFPNNRLFAENQLYVMLSRLKVPEGVEIADVLTILK
jgi:ATP-dependent exoDNAse (exonuclease V) alpha subunit